MDSKSIGKLFLFAFSLSSAVSFAFYPVSAKSVQDAIKEMEVNNKRAYDQNQQKVHSITESIERENQRVKSAFSSIPDTNKAILKSTGMTEYRHIEYKNGRPVSKFEFKADPASTTNANGSNPTKQFTNFLWALRKASALNTVQNYLYNPSTSCTLDSLKSKFGEVSQIVNCKVTGNQAVITAKTQNAGHITISMKSDGNYWRIAGQ